MNSRSPLAIPEAVAKTNQRFLDARRDLSIGIVADRNGLETADALRTITDRWLCRIWAQAIPDDFDDTVSLYATGGYGRNELAYHSDIDVLIALHDPQLAQNEAFSLAIERLMAWSRQTRLRISHAVRTGEQAHRAVDDDPRNAISLLDMRRLCGPPATDERFGRPAVIEHLRGDDDGKTFVASLIEGMRHRIARHGKTVFLLEPDVKNGEGGLRDLNCISWAARVRWQLDARRDLNPDVGWTEEHRQTYCRRLSHLLALRNRLHLLRDRKHDRLSFREQEALVRLIDHDQKLESADQVALRVDQALDGADAATAGQQTHHSHHRAIEAQMGKYYRRARSIALNTERFLRRWAAADHIPRPVDGPFEIRGEHLCVADDLSIGADDVFDALVLAGNGDLLLAPGLEAKMERCVEQWPIGDDTPAPLAHRLRRLLSDPTTAPRTSRRLLELGVLTRIIPEFRPLVCHVQHDLFHVYTTDVHSLKCLEAARSLVASAPDELDRPFFGHIAAQIDDIPVYLLASLFHDIGKNRGGQHSEKGALIMESVGPRLGLDKAQTKDLAFLVRHHLALSTTSRRRDISAPEIIDELAELIGDPGRLDQLTALTFCDMSTVSPDVMNDWNASLLSQLYSKLHEALLSPATETSKNDCIDAQGNRSRCRRKLQAQLADHRTIDSTHIDVFVGDLGAEHISDTSIEALARQCLIYCAARESDDDVAVSSMPLVERGVTEVIVSGPDRPGTLARIAGAIASVGINIMAADIVTTASGRTLDIFLIARFNPRAVPPTKPRPVDTDRRLQRLEERIVDVLCERVDIDEILAQRQSEQRLAPRPLPSVSTEVRTDPDASSRYTVLEVRAPDRVGLLYTIANTMLECRVNTRVSRIDSLGHQAIDTFYVEEWDGAGLSDERVDEVAQALRKVL